MNIEPDSITLIVSVYNNGMLQWLVQQPMGRQSKTAARAIFRVENLNIWVVYNNGCLYFLKITEKSKYTKYNDSRNRITTSSTTKIGPNSLGSIDQC